MKTKKQWGGFRPGSGLKPEGDKPKISLTVRVDEKAILKMDKERGEKSRGKYVQEAILKA